MIHQSINKKHKRELKPFLITPQEAFILSIIEERTASAHFLVWSNFITLTCGPIYNYLSVGSVAHLYSLLLTYLAIEQLGEVAPTVGYAATATELGGAESWRLAGMQLGETACPRGSSLARPLPRWPGPTPARDASGWLPSSRRLLGARRPCRAG
jgi:hypothetical protein